MATEANDSIALSTGTMSFSGSLVLPGIATIKVKNQQGKSVELRVIIDSGSR